MLGLSLQRFTEHGEEVRARLVQIIRKRPGIHKSELGRLAGLSWGSLSHHLLILKRHNRIRVQVMQNRLVLYGANVRDEDLRWIQVLRDPLTEQVLARVQESPGLRAQAIADQMSGVSRKIIRRHLTRLEEIGYVRRSEDYHPRFFPVGGMGRDLPASMLLPQQDEGLPAPRPDLRLGSE